MKSALAAFIACIVMVTAAGCTGKSGDSGVTGKKVADQRLAVYNSIRRLLYRDACGSAGPITICVDKIVISDTATVVETRVRNSSAQAYLDDNAGGAGVLRAAGTDEALQLHPERAGQSVGPGESRLVFRVEDKFQGNPAVLAINKVVGIYAEGMPEQSNGGLSILVRLDEGHQSD